MSTIWEMAAIIRAEEALAGKPAPAQGGERRGLVDVEAPGEAAYWCRCFGTTPMRLCSAIARVGREPAALRRFFRLPQARRRAR